MAIYRVYFENVCSTSIEVEWDGDPNDLHDAVDDLIEMAQKSDDMPGGITISAFGGGMGVSVDDGEWNATVISTPDGKDIEI